MKTTGKYTHKTYVCTRCGHREEHGTNHFGQIYCHCPQCSWRNGGAIAVWECMEEPPEGMGVPEPWRIVKLGEVATIL